MVPRLGAVGRALMSAGLALLCACTRAPERSALPIASIRDDVARVPASWPESITVVFTASSLASGGHTRAPELAIADTDRVELSRCAMAQTLCTATIPRRDEYVLTITDAMGDDARQSISRMEVPPSLTRITVLASYIGPREPEAEGGPGWWFGTTIILHRGDYANEVRLSPIGARTLRAQNTSSEALLVDSVAQFRYFDHGEWLHYGGYCGTELPDPPYLLAPGETAEVRAAVGAMSLDPVDDAPHTYRAQLGVSVVRSEGVVVPAHARNLRVPEPMVVEERLAVTRLDGPRGWAL